MVGVSKGNKELSNTKGGLRESKRQTGGRPFGSNSNFRHTSSMYIWAPLSKAVKVTAHADKPAGSVCILPNIAKALFKLGMLLQRNFLERFLSLNPPHLQDGIFF